MKKVISDYIDSVDNHIFDFVTDVISDENSSFKRTNISCVSDRQITDVKKILGLDVSGYLNAINTNAIRHIIRRHGSNGVADNSMRDINDIARIGYVLKNYDTVNLLKENNDEILSTEFMNSDNTAAPMLIYSKKINGTYYIVQAVPESKHKKMWIVSAYISNKNEAVTQALITDDKSLDGMSLASPTSTDSISNSTDNVKYSSRQDNVKKAEEYFGTTYSIKEAGYLLIDGKLLDFSGRNQGASGGSRSIDHREIAEAFDEDYAGNSYSGGMIRFMSEGNIRLSPESGGINLSVKPNKAQQSVLDRYISNFRGEVIVDIDDINGNTLVSVEYPKYVHSSVILNDINDYFDKGKDIVKFSQRNKNYFDISVIDRYTEKQYNNFGWVTVNNVLTPDEYTHFNQQLADLKYNKFKYTKTKDGEYIIPVGSDSQKLVYVNGSYQNPIIIKVVKINLDVEYVGRVKDDIIEYEQNNYREPYRIIADYFGPKVVDIYQIRNYDSYRSIKNARREGASGRYGVGDSEGIENRRGSGKTNRDNSISNAELVKFQSRPYQPTFSDLGLNGIEQNTQALERDVKHLHKLLQLQTRYTDKAVEDVVSKLMKEFGLPKGKNELILKLKDFYSYISKFDASADDIIRRSEAIARWVEDKKPPKIVKDEYVESVLKNIRSVKISLDDVQREELNVLY